MSKIIMGIKLIERVKTAKDFQELLTKYGCDINTRLGLHSASSDSCSPDGIIILEFVNDVDDKVEEFEKKLHEIGKVEVQKMIF